MDSDLSQVQCIRSYQAQEHDELTLEKADILQAKTITSDGKTQIQSWQTMEILLNLNYKGGNPANKKIHDLLLLILKCVHNTERQS